ncbi:hypothetical protein [Stenotrophomonas oahuensis]|uniref:Uncharacterized protein n=1 Tax=Stenotrophomonas oahuensis TaxID=3003271 RepID=A0ABY9YXE1_9GAMM|nr:hypothetical protein [Stenotrophomonas sp. A5586]WNH54839.1 hypothetical protein PDM29_20715 [Stenotrophomonas sp. A5586]
MSVFGYEQTVKFEVARDLLNSRRAHIAADLGRERTKVKPDPSAIGRLQADMRAIAHSIRHLDVRDEAALDSVIAANRSREFASVA